MKHERLGSRSQQARTETPNVTVSDIGKRLEVVQNKLDVITAQRGRLGELYWKITPASQDAEEDRLEKERGILQRIHQVGSAYEDLLQMEVSFPEPNIDHLPAVDILHHGAVSTEGRDPSLREKGLQLFPIPAFPERDPKVLDEMIKGSKYPAVRNILTEPYLRGVQEGRIPVLHAQGYYLAVDSPAPVTELSDSLGLGNVQRATMADVASAARENGSDALRTVLGSRASESYTRPLTAKEDRLVGAVQERDDSIVTFTRDRTTRRHLRFINGELAEQDATQPGPTRLVTVFSKDQRPPLAQYIKAKSA